MAKVRLVGLTKRFGDVTAVREVNLVVADKEFLVLVGPSGCGKTTTLRMIAGLEDVSDGEIYIGDRLVNDVLPKDRDIAMVFQNYALYPHMNVYDNMSFGLRLRHMPRPQIDRRVREAADMLGIGALLRRRPKELSGGQRQRVALGRAIVRDPAIFLMDEPLSNLDAKLRVQMRAEIGKLHRRLATTVVYVTHDQVEAMTMGHRIVVMRDGVVQQVATPQKLYDRPANRFVAGFIGSPGMNFLQCAVRGAGGEAHLCGQGFRMRVPDALRPALDRAAGRELWLGVRPEDVSLDAAFAASHPGCQIRATVEVVEPLGAEQHLYFTAEGADLTVRAAPELRVRPGERLQLTVDPDKLHLFDAETELAYR